jgi:hypothetical protein
MLWLTRRRKGQTVFLFLAFVERNVDGGAGGLDRKLRQDGGR